MTDEEKSRRPFENNTPEEGEPEKWPHEIRRGPFELVEEEPVTKFINDAGKLEIVHGNIFDHEPLLTPEQGQMALKRLKDEGYEFGD